MLLEFTLYYLLAAAITSLFVYTMITHVLKEEYDTGVYVILGVLWWFTIPLILYKILFSKD